MSIRKVRVTPVAVFWASSCARTCRVYWPSAGKSAAANAYDQSPPEREAVWKTSPALPKDVPFQ